MIRPFAFALAVPLALGMSGCSTLEVNAYRPEAKVLLVALDSQPDGASGVLEQEGERVSFRIVQTYASDVKLCRVVTLKSETRRVKSVESYCKAKGGQWR